MGLALIPSGQALSRCVFFRNLRVFVTGWGRGTRRGKQGTQWPRPDSGWDVAWTHSPQLAYPGLPPSSLLSVNFSTCPILARTPAPFPSCIFAPAKQNSCSSAGGEGVHQDREGYKPLTPVPGFQHHNESKSNHDGTRPQQIRKALFIKRWNGTFSGEKKATGHKRGLIFTRFK